ncbi:MAG TPA: hypothetical protein EYP69_05735, partial [Bacteroidales bacterium]|nr:hypothetical protein [Bacteroidales bacterium]
MNRPKIILIGGSGHCKACIDVIEAENKFQIEGILDLPIKYGSKILGYKVIGNDDNIPNKSLNIFTSGNNYIYQFFKIYSLFLC